MHFIVRVAPKRAIEELFMLPQKVGKVFLLRRVEMCPIFENDLINICLFILCI